MPDLNRIPSSLFRILAAASAVTLCSAAAHAGGPDQPQPTEWSAESSWDIAGEWVVDFHDEVEESTIQAELSGHGLAFRETALEDDSLRIIGSEQGRDKIAFADRDILYLNKGANAGVRAGDRYSVHMLGRDIRHPVTGKKLGHKVIELYNLP